MGKLEILDNITHHGIVLKKGMVVDDGAAHPSSSAQNLTSVLTGLVDRGLARVTEAAVTHTLSLVDSAQNALPVDKAAGGEAPKAEQDEAVKARQKAEQEQATPEQQKAAAEEDTQLSKPVAPVKAPTADQKQGPRSLGDRAKAAIGINTGQPDPADVSATADSVQ